MNDTSIRALIALNIALACSPLASAATPATTPPEARAAAQLGLYDWINEYIKDEVQPQQDFVLKVDSLEQLKSARVGRGLAMKIVDSGALIAGNSLRQAARPNGEWRFLIMVDEHAVGLADVRSVAGKYQMVGLGGKVLAQNIEKTLAPYPDRAANLVRSHQARADYMELAADHAGHVHYAPLQTTDIGTPVARTAGDAHLIEEDALATALRGAIARDTGSED